MSTLYALSQWLNMVRNGLGQLHVHGSGFKSWSSPGIQPKSTNAHALIIKKCQFLGQEKWFDGVLHNMRPLVIFKGSGI